MDNAIGWVHPELVSTTYYSPAFPSSPMASFFSSTMFTASPRDADTLILHAKDTVQRGQPLDITMVIATTNGTINASYQ
jgi:hypothetical protein